MNPRFITFWMVVFVITVVVGLVSAFLVIGYGSYVRQTEVSLLPEKDMELVDSYDIDAQPYIRHTVYVYHDNDRNVTCYLYDDGISCVPDRFLEEVRK